MFGSILVGVVRLIVVLGINLSIFLIIPLSQEAFKALNGIKDQTEVPQRQLVAEIIKKKDEPKKVQQSNKIRSVQTSTGKALQGKMDFKLSPDLALANSGDGVAVATDNITAEVFEEGEVENPAVPLFFPQPPFPKEARELAIEGEVKVVFIVNPDGRVGAIEEISAPHPSFEREVRRTFTEWKFKPAQNKGVPVQSRKSIIIEFSLES